MMRLENPSGGIVQVDAELAKTLKAQGWVSVPKRGKTAQGPASGDANTGDDNKAPAGVDETAANGADQGASQAPADGDGDGKAAAGSAKK